MNFKIFSILIAKVLLYTPVTSKLYERGLQPLSGQGDITYYGEGGSDPAPTGPGGGSPGACALAPKNNNYFAALNYIQYGEYPNPNNSVVCGRCVKVVHGSNEVVVEIVDKCPVCKSGDVDLSPTAFKDLFGGLEVGRVSNVKWFEVSCSELGKSKSNSNPGQNSDPNPVQNPDPNSNSNPIPIPIPKPGNDNKNIVNNDWNTDNGWNVPNITTKTIPNNTVTTKTIPNNTFTTKAIPTNTFTPKTIPNDNITIRTITRDSVTTKTIPKTTSKTVPITYTIKTKTKKPTTVIPSNETPSNENPSNGNPSNGKHPIPITITTSIVLTTVVTIPITTVITDYNYYQAAPTGLP